MMTDFQDSINRDAATFVMHGLLPGLWSFFSKVRLPQYAFRRSSFQKISAYNNINAPSAHTPAPGTREPIGNFQARNETNGKPSSFRWFLPLFSLSDPGLKSSLSLYTLLHL
jgi:hypothetical protein